MAAGVSISPISVIGFTCFSLFLVGTTGLKGVPYAVSDALPPLDSLYLVEDVRPHYDDGYVILERHRRQATHSAGSSPPPPNSTLPTTTPSTTIPTTTPSTTTTTTIPTTSTTTTTTTTTTTKTTTTTTKTTPTTTVLPPSSSKPTSPLITHSTVNKTVAMTTKPTTQEVTTEPMTGSSDTTNTTGTEEPLLNEEENHKYYWSRILNGVEAESMWVDLDRMSKTGKNTHVTLSNSHRTAATVRLSFVFPFYGHEVHQVTIATGGFLYMSDFLHQWLTATQYIAPLMANFDSQIGNNSHIHYADNGTAFAVQWESVYLQDHQKGPFNFQVILHEDGKVIFGYKDIPVAVESIPNAQHPVKVGLSDAYYVDRNINKEVRRRTIYEYHRVAVPMSRIENNTAVILRPNPTCIAISDCRSCIEANISFACQWCPNARRCSDGLDRRRQDWLQRRCSQVEFSSPDECSRYPTGPGGKARFATGPDSQPHSGHVGSGFNVGGAIAIVIMVLLLILIVSWFVYAYKNPTSRSGMWLIDHRPSMLKAKLSKVRFWKRGGDAGEKYEVSMQPEGDSVA